MFQLEPPAILDELIMRSHLTHSTPVGRPFICSGQAPIVVPCSILAFVGVVEWDGCGCIILSWGRGGNPGVAD